MSLKSVFVNHVLLDNASAETHYCFTGNWLCTTKVLRALQMTPRFSTTQSQHASHLPAGDQLWPTLEMDWPIQTAPSQTQRLCTFVRREMSNLALCRDGLPSRGSGTSPRIPPPGLCGFRSSVQEPLRRRKASGLRISF